MLLKTLGLALLLNVSLLDFGHAAKSSSTFDLGPAQIAMKNAEFEKVTGLLSPQVEHLGREGLFILAQAYSSLKNHEAAIKTYSTCLSFNARDYQAKTLIGVEQLFAQKNVEALSSLREALEINPKYKPAYEALIQHYEKKNHKYELRLLYEDLLANLGETTTTVSKLCQLSFEDRLYDLAMKYCLRGMALDSKVPSNHVYLGMVYNETKETEKADDILKKTAARFLDSGLAQLKYAQFLEESKNFLVAYSYYKKAALADEQSAVAWVGLGNSSLELQKYSESLAAFEKACHLSKTVRPTFRRAAIQLKKLKIDDWLKKFEASIEKCL
jgi:tetratricopeptide (TPR) repeat protein